MLQLQRHNMKKLLLTWISLLLVSLSWAAKAWKMPLTVTQPDGSVLQAYQHGDEHFNWYTDKDGVILIRKADIFYIAHIDQYGKISSSNLLAHEKSQRQDAEKRAVAAQNRNLFFERAQQRIETRAMRREPVQVDGTFFHTRVRPKPLLFWLNTRTHHLHLPILANRSNSFSMAKDALLTTDTVRVKTQGACKNISRT